MKKAIITGITGQDGSYLAELLLEKGYEVHGVYRRSSSPNFSKLYSSVAHKNFNLVEGDICDPFFVSRLIEAVKPDEYYNLAAQSHVATSFEQPSYTWEATGTAVLYALEAIRTVKPSTKFYQASSSEMFGKNFTVLTNDYGEDPIKFQDEQTPFYPQSPYAIAKLSGHHLVRNYRDSYKIFACSGILFNHESERRGDNFVTRKITKWLGEFIASEKSEDFPKLRLGNLDARRDWGHAEDYVRAMWLMLQQETPDDYVVATGEAHTIKDFLVEAFGSQGLNWEDYVVIDPKFYRPAEVDFLRGISTKARTRLSWEPEISFGELVERMVNSDLEKARLQRSTLQEV
ncbi:MAG: GDP-mannose 4,6-dehydratase [Lyngbya sp.]|nr:GDP-mannose 4,6-dehydratase [Lyngbya sp.]